MRRRRQPDAPALPPAVMDVAIHGWGHERDQNDPSYDWLQPFLVRDWAALYREHKTLIDAEARRRGVERPAAAEE